MYYLFFNNYLIDAVCLESQGRYDGAYYLAGYTTELLIKAKVCKNLGIDDFFDFDNTARKTKIKSEVLRPFKVHDLEQLLILSGVYSDFEKMLVDVDFGAAWSIIQKWNEGTRYLTGRSHNDVKDLLTSISIFEKWIQRYL